MNPLIDRLARKDNHVAVSRMWALANLKLIHGLDGENAGIPYPYPYPLPLSLPLDLTPSPNPDPSDAFAHENS